MIFKKRLVILIPTHYNADSNGIREKINDDEYTITYKELMRKLGGCTYDPTVKKGAWKDDDGKEYYDDNTSFYSDYDDTETNRQFLNDYKEILRIRFKQKAIYMTISPIEII